MGKATSGNGLWAAVAVAVVGARESMYTGGSIRMASMRILGTVLGALFGYFVLVVVRKPMSAAVRSTAMLFLLAGWVAVLSKVRTISAFSYGALVAQFSAYIVVFSTPNATAGGDVSEAVAWTRIEQNVLGEALAALCSVPPRPPVLLGGLRCCCRSPLPQHTQGPLRRRAAPLVSSACLLLRDGPCRYCHFRCN